MIKGGDFFQDVTNGHNNTSVAKRVRNETRLCQSKKFPFTFYFSVLSNASSNKGTPFNKSTAPIECRVRQASSQNRSEAARL